MVLTKLSNIMIEDYKISIIVNCFNGEKYLERCLNSILKQSLDNWELIFFDNRSTDGSRKIFEKYQDSRFKYFQSAFHIKLYEARNEALKKTNGDFIAFLDTDDWWEPFHLENAVPFFKRKNFGLYFSNAFNYFEKKKLLKLHRKKLPKIDIFNSLISDYSVKISSLIIRKKILKILDKNEVFNNKFNIIGDYDLVTKIASKFDCCSNDFPSVYCSFHGENYSLKNREEYIEEFNYWFDNIDFDNKKFLENRDIIKDNILYINLFQEITKHKKIKIFINILNVHDLKKRIKLMIMFFIPKFIIQKLLNRY